MVIWRRENIHQHVNGTAPRNDLHVFTTCGFIVELQNIPQKHDTPVVNPEFR